MTKTLLTFILICFIIFSNGQNTKRISLSGQVINAKTQEPIQHAEIFISGTTVGCISDSLGNFNLKIPFVPCTLVADHVAFESFIQPLENNEDLKIKLKPENNQLSEVEVSGKNMRKKNLQYFYAHFIHGNSRKVEILNDSILHFLRDEKKFIASSTQPLIIINHYLGYRIRLIIDKFEVSVIDKVTGKELSLNSVSGKKLLQITGYYLYEPLDTIFPEKKNLYEKNRQESYLGSYRHLLKAVYNNNLNEQGFDIDVFSKENHNAFYNIPDFKSTNDIKEYLIKADSLKVNYYFDRKHLPVSIEQTKKKRKYYMQTSTIYPSQYPFIIRSNGTSPNLTFIIDGLMIQKSFIHSLPEDYMSTKQ